MQQRLEQGSSLSVGNATGATHPLISVVLRQALGRPILVVTEGVKTQENFQQDVETWLKSFASDGKAFFYPAWEVLPEESRLPHSDVISERLETLAGLTLGQHKSPIIVTSAAALLQKTFPPSDLSART